jgi:hypothetical protein
MNFNFTFTEQEINILLKGLGELPAKESINLILKIKQSCEIEIKNNKQKI